MWRFVIIAALVIIGVIVGGLKTFSSFVGSSARKKDLGGGADNIDLVEKTPTQQFIKQASPPTLPPYDILTEDYRGMMRDGKNVSLHSDKADYYLQSMSPYGFVEALDTDRYIVKIRKPEGRTLYVLLTEKSFEDEKKVVDKSMIMP